MPIKNETPTRFMDEVKIISPWAFIIAGLAFVLAVVIVVVADARDNHAPPVALAALLGLLGGAVIACYILLIGYVSRDAGRRGMSRVLWTLIAIFIPNALGIVLYFILRKPRPMTCPQCSAEIEPGFGFCPRCRYRLNPICPHCQRGVNAADKFCPYCGGDLGAEVKAGSSTVPGQI